MTPATGSLTMSIDPSSPSYAVINGGATGVTVDVIKFHASTESMTLNKIGLNMPAGYGSSSDVITAYLYNGSQLLGTTQFVQGATSATSTLTTSLNLPKDTDVLVTVKADFADIGISQSGTEGKLIEVNPLNAQASGLSSGSTVNSALVSGTVAGVRVFNSYPTVVLDSTLPSTGMADGRLMHFKVTAANSGPVGLQQFVFQIATTTATVSNVGLYAYTDPGYSSPISSQTNGEIGNANLTLVNPNSNSGTAYATATPATNPVEVPAGSSLYFELRGSVTGVTTGASVVTTLLGDAAYPTNLTNGYYVATSTALTAAYNNHFVWSGNATSTSGIYDVDWSNSYGLPGFSSGGLIQTRSN
jgi:hypothetical protein